MIWNAFAEHATEKVIQEAILPLYQQGLIKRLLGYNEPDRPEQANMSIWEAAQFWPILESARIPLASPAASTDHAPWMGNWIKKSQESNFRNDYIAIHWYGWPSVNAFKQEMWDYYIQAGGKAPLMITEFAPADWSAKTVGANQFSRKDVLKFMKQVLPWMEEQEWIAGYAWFPFRASWPPGTCSSLFEEDGTPTKLGEYYASVTSDNPYGDQSISY